MEQNHTEGRGRLGRKGARFDDFGAEAAGRCGSDQPKPRAGCRHTAQSAKRGCQEVNRAVAEVGDGDMKLLHHAATANRAPLASLIRARIAVRLNFRLNMAEAW